MKTNQRMVYLTMLMQLAALSFVVLLISCKNGEETGPQLPQVPGKATVSVKDELGSPYPNVKVTLFMGNKIDDQKYTDESGMVELNSKDTGTYQMKLVTPLSTEAVTELPADINIKANQTANVAFIIQPQPVKALLNFGSVDLFSEIKDKDGNMPVNPTEPLYAANVFDEPLGLLNAIKAPDGHHVTLSEWQTAQGNLTVHCNGNSSTVDIALKGLIPNGTYTLHCNFLNKAKSAGQAINFANDLAKRNSLGSGTKNIVVADANGTVNASIQHASCILTEEVALVIPVIYHINGKTFGENHIPDPEEVNQMLVYFQ